MQIKADDIEEQKYLERPEGAYLLPPKQI